MLAVSASLNPIGPAIKQYSPGVGAPEPITQPLTKITIAMLDKMSDPASDLDIFQNLSLRRSLLFRRTRSHQLAVAEYPPDNRRQLQSAANQSGDVQLARSPMNIETAAATAASAVE